MIRNWLSVAVLVGISIAAPLAEAARLPRVGQAPPPLVGSTVDGRPVSVAEYRGKVVVLSFWATWCKPCRKELPMLEGLQRAAGTENLQVIAVNLESASVFRRQVARMTDFKSVLIRDERRKTSKAYGIDAIPCMVIVGRDGLVRKVNLGYNEDKLEAVIADVNAALLAP